MRSSELNKYIVKCEVMADTITDDENVNHDEMNHPSDYGDCPLTDYIEELKALFESREDVDIEEIEKYLKSEFSNIKSVEPIE